MEARIETLPKKTIVGKSIRMSLANNKTKEVWQSFMRNRSLITNAVGKNYYSLQAYDNVGYFKDFSPQTEFTKWAATEVENIDNIPNGFRVFTIPEGLYAVFLHKGDANEFPKTMYTIFSEWLPQSNYNLDHRPHFELLGEGYQNNDPNSEEEVWIPIKQKT